MLSLDRRTYAFILTAALVLTPAMVHAQTTIYVDDDAPPGGDGATWATAYDSLSDALAAAQSGDQIWVAAGTYMGNFTLALGVELYGGFAGTETELEERDWAANPTILDGDASGSVVTSPSGATATTRIDGFTVTNGWNDEGGGLYLRESSPTIANNKITGNEARFDGGGLLLQSSLATIANNTVTDNFAQLGGGMFVGDSAATISGNTIMGNMAGSGGAGMFLVGSSGRITNNTIAANAAGTHGGGMRVAHESTPMIANNTITANSADEGGGIDLYSSSPTIANNVIANNGAWHGGGLYAVYSSPTIANNTITNNYANEGGGLYLGNYSSPKITNVIVAFNSSGVYRDGPMGAPLQRYNCVYGNTAYDYFGLCDPTGTDGNISADPILADPQYGNLHIQPDSPCVDAGSKGDVFGELDMDGELRIQPPGGTVDIGADESDGTYWSEGPYTIVRVSSSGNDSNDGSSWSLAKRTVQAGIDAASDVGGEVWVQGGTYEERITLHPYAYLYGGFVGGEIVREERDWDVHVTILDGQEQGSVVTARAGHAVSAIDGFTITNGRASHGGGVYLYYSSPAIANNVIANNGARHGGGLYLHVSSPMITNNTITGNNADGNGGGLSMLGSSPAFANNTVTGNGADDYGGGLYLHYSAATLANNTITGNNASVFGGGLCSGSA